LTDASYVPRTSENPPITRDINDEAENSVIAPAVMILPIRLPPSSVNQWRRGRRGALPSMFWACPTPAIVRGKPAWLLGWRQASRSRSLRESDILRLIAGGLANKEIGAKLQLSEKTIRASVTTASESKL
jgi:DNA-binding NarL/FixJ family response regulator